MYIGTEWVTAIQLSVSRLQSCPSYLTTYESFPTVFATSIHSKQKYTYHHIKSSNKQKSVCSCLIFNLGKIHTCMPFVLLSDDCANFIFSKINSTQICDVKRVIAVQHLINLNKRLFKYTRSHNFAKNTSLITSV